MDYKIYGIYNGEVHRIEVGRTGEVFLCPDTGDATDNRYPNRDSLIPYAEYKGYKTFIAREVGDEYEIYVNDYAVAQKLGFDRCDKYCYNLMVKKSDVNVIYEKVPVKI